MFLKPEALIGSHTREPRRNGETDLGALRRQEAATYICEIMYNLQ